MSNEKGKNPSPKAYGFNNNLLFNLNYVSNIFEKKNKVKKVLEKQ